MQPRFPAGVDMKVVQETLDHSSVVLTANTYTSVYTEVVIAAAEATARIVPHARRDARRQPLPVESAEHVGASADDACAGDDKGANDKQARRHAHDRSSSRAARRSSAARSDGPTPTSRTLCSASAAALRSSLPPLSVQTLIDPQVPLWIVLPEHGGTI